MFFKIIERLARFITCLYTKLPMNGDPIKTVLLIEDNEDDIKAIQAALTVGNYRVAVARTARQAFTDIFKAPPDLVILDINLPDLDGFHVARELKRNMMFRHIPVIVLTSRIDFLEKMRSFDVVVDEYLVRPFDPKDLLLRTDLVHQRVQANLDANPLTRLPGNMVIVKELRARLGQGKPYAVGYVDLNNFKAFNDKYGFSRGDFVIQFAARVIISATQKLSPSQNFVGHIGGDDFIFICDYDHANEVCQRIIDTFDREVPNLYSEEDRKRGYVVVEDRRGVVSQFPLLSISIGMVSDEGTKFSNLGQVNHSLTQLKKYAKSFQGSAYVRDRRSLSSQLAEFTWGPGSNAGSSKVLENITQALGSYMPGQLAEIIKNRAITVLFQPILDMKEDDVMGHEALVRGPAGTPLEFPDALFQTARTVGCVPQLDVLCMQQILSASGEFRKGIKIFVNIFPETLLEWDSLQSILNDPRARHLDWVFELSGSNRASDAREILHTLGRLKSLNLKVCLDASGSILSQGLRELSDLRPHYIKLNMNQFKNMTSDARAHNEFLQSIALVRQVGAEIICSKLESRADSFLALKAGLRWGQGFLFARPALPVTTTPR